MKFRILTIETQNFASTLGLAHNDHIESEVLSTDCENQELDAEIEQQITEITEKYRQEIEKRIDQWFQANPNQTECLCEGEEFVGTLWLESKIREEENPDLDKTQEQILAIRNTWSTRRMRKPLWSYFVTSTTSLPPTPLPYTQKPHWSPILMVVSAV